MKNIGYYASAVGKGFAYVGKPVLNGTVYFGRELIDLIMHYPAGAEFLKMDEDGARRYLIARELRVDVDDPQVDLKMDNDDI